MRTVIYFSVLTILSIMMLFAQTASAASDAARPGADSSANLGKFSVGQEVPATPGARDAGVENRRRGIEEKPANAFVGLVPQSGTRKVPLRNEVALIALIVAVHAAVTWDAQSTNHFFHHYPAGYRPAEVDPIMRPFAGKALMYPMANLFFAVPSDLALLKTRHCKTPIRAMAYAAATAWMGMEIRQSLINIGNERIKIGK